MKSKIILVIAFTLTCSLKLAAQDVKPLEALKSKVAGVILNESSLPETKFKTLENLILNDPTLYNEVWGRVYNTLRKKGDRFIFKNLKINFETFQATDSNKTSLGFSYRWDYEFNKKRSQDYRRSEILAKFNADGNIAFKQNLNPNDFQSGKFDIGLHGFLGGTVNKSDVERIAEFNKINVKLTAIDDSVELAASPLWNEITDAMGITNQYHYNISARAGWEGKQDFKTSQYTYGLQVRFSAKAYSDKNPLSQLNMLDYPFAVIRFLTGTDRAINPYGAALPIITLGVERVDPSKDTLRKSVSGTLDQFTRIRFETGFRTLLAEIDKITLYFNASYQYFKEVSPSPEIKAAHVDRFSYISFSITAADNYFVSYSYGKLPFDRTDNAKYALGFKFNL